MGRGVTTTPLSASASSSNDAEWMRGVIGEPAWWGRLALAVFATWRVSHLLAAEDGPGGLVARLRRRLGDSFAGGLLDCFGCVSLWVAIPFAAAVADGLSAWVMAWLGVAGAAFVLERLGPAPLMVQPWRDTDHELLRTAEGGPDIE